MAYSKAKLKSSGDKASPCFRPFWIGKLSDRCLPIRTLLYVSFNVGDFFHGISSKHPVHQDDTLHNLQCFLPRFCYFERLTDPTE
jgi:hypothetical protein